MITKEPYVKLHGGISQINNLTYSEGFGQNSAILNVDCENPAINLNGIITMDLGYNEPSGVVLDFFYGRIKSINRMRGEANIRVVIKDVLVDATDFFLVSEDPENPFTWGNIKAEDLVQDLLERAGIEKYVSQVPMTFTYGINEPVKFNLLSSMDAANQIANMLAWNIYANYDTVYFKDVKPYYRTGSQKDTEYGTGGHSDDVISHAFCSDGTLTVLPTGVTELKTGIESIERTFTDEGIRNKVVVYGYTSGIGATSFASSPYLPANFYKTSVIQSNIIDSNTLAQAAADFNLILYNRLTESCTLTVMGDPTIRARQFIQVEDDYTGTTGYWFIHDVTHSIGSDGYICKLTLTK